MKRIRRGTFKSVRDLKREISVYATEHNKNAKPSRSKKICKDHSTKKPEVPLHLPVSTLGRSPTALENARLRCDLRRRRRRETAHCYAGVRSRKSRGGGHLLATALPQRTIKEACRSGASSRTTKKFSRQRLQTALQEIGARHTLMTPVTPRWNGKPENLSQKILRAWAYAMAYRTSDERRLALPAWLRHHNQQREHSAQLSLTELPAGARIVTDPRRLDIEWRHLGRTTSPGKLQADRRRSCAPRTGASARCGVSKDIANGPAATTTSQTRRPARRHGGARRAERRRASGCY